MELGGCGGDEELDFLESGNEPEAARFGSGFPFSLSAELDRDLDFLSVGRVFAFALAVAVAFLVGQGLASVPVREERVASVVGLSNWVLN